MLIVSRLQPLMELFLLFDTRESVGQNFCLKIGLQIYLIG